MYLNIVTVRNSSLHKRLSFCPQGGSGRHPPPAGPFWADTPPWQTPPRQNPPPWQTPRPPFGRPPLPMRRPQQWTVGILLECILVLKLLVTENPGNFAAIEFWSLKFGTVHHLRFYHVHENISACLARKYRVFDMPPDDKHTTAGSWWWTGGLFPQVR